MNAKPITPDGLLSELELGDLKPSWVGAYPPKQGAAVAGEDGRILLVNKDGTTGGIDAKTDEAINALAFSPPWLAISTRSEVRFLDMTAGRKITSIPIRYGSHGVIADCQGNFLAPLGTNGLLSFEPREGNQLPVTISRPGGDEICFYKVICLKDFGGRQVIAVAARRDGMAIILSNSNEPSIHTLSFDGFDAVDLCPLADSSPSAAILGRDGTIMICHDVVDETLKKQAMAATRFADIRGTAYRILSTAGHLIVVTSQAVYILGDMANKFLHGQTGPATVLELPIKAVDANVVNEHWLMILTSRGIQRLDVRKLDWGRTGHNGTLHRKSEPVALNPVCQGRESRMMAA